MKIYHDSDADIADVRGKTIAVIGYGAQGRAQAQCMKDSGLRVIVGARENRAGWKQASEDGLEVMPIAEAARQADIVHVLLPDEVHGEVYGRHIRKGLEEGNTLSFSHGFSIVFGQVAPPEGVDVIMVAPKGPGPEERKRYLEGVGVPGLISVHRDASGNARQTALAMAKAMMFTRTGVVECTFEQETYSDLFGEQSVLCGGVSELVKAGFETLVDAGYPPEIAYFECLHELKLIADLVQERGLEGMWEVVSNTAEYGGRTRGQRIVGEEARMAMRSILKDIESGSFAREWIQEHRAGLPKFNKLRAEQAGHRIEKVGKGIRALFEGKQ